MAYIGSSTVIPITTQIRPRDEFVSNGFQKEYFLSQEIPGGFESNVLAIVDNVPQEPISAYTIKDIQRLTISAVSANTLRSVNLEKPTSSPYTGVTNYSANTTLITAVNQLLNGQAPFAARANNTIRLEQRLVSNNNLVSSMTIDKTDSLTQPTAFNGTSVSGIFTSNTINEYVIFHDATANDFLALTTTGLVTRANTGAISNIDDKFYTVSSFSSEIEQPKAGDKITQASSGAIGFVANATSSFVDVVLSGSTNFTTQGSGGGVVNYVEGKSVDFNTDTITYESIITGSFDVTAVSTIKFRGLQFTGFPRSGQKILINHLGGSNFQVNPTAGSVTDLALSDNLKTFTVDKFTSTQGQTTFTLSKSPVSVQSILVTINGVVQTDTVGYTLQNQNQLLLSAPLNAGISVNVLHLGFSTVSRNSFVDGAITAAAIQDLGITGSKIANNTITSSKLVAGSAIANIGYTPHDPTSVSQQSYTGGVTFNAAVTLANGHLVFPGTANPATNDNTLDEYREGDYTPSLSVAAGGNLNTLTYGTRLGKFIKIGRLCKVSGSITITALGASNGNLFITLPFSTNQTGNRPKDWGTLVISNVQGTFTNPIIFTDNFGLSNTAVYVMKGATQATVADLTSTSVLEFSITYITEV